MTDVAETLPTLAPSRTPGRAVRPVRVLQFGTGRFLMGFLGPFIDRANRDGGYDGHALIVQQTGTDRADAIAAQAGLYTLVERGGTAAEPIDRRHLVDAYAGAVSIAHDWDRLMAVARSPDLSVIVSNVTESGLRIDPADTLAAPVSYPARLASLLIERWRSGMRGVVVLPCELVEDNGRVLAGLVRSLVDRGGVDPAFSTWLDGECVFADTLVDRIVTGMPGAEEQRAIENELGYRDALLIVAEPYALFAIAGDVALADRIGFVVANPAIRVEPDIGHYRDLKLRLLNGGHSASAAVAILAGHRLVREAMADDDFMRFVSGMLGDEIAPTIDAPRDVAHAYIDDVLARWANPAIDHHWRDIAGGYAAKLGMRLAAPIATARTRDRLAIGMAAVAVLMRDADYRQRAGWPDDADPIAALGDADFAAQVRANIAKIDTDGVRALIS